MAGFFTESPPKFWQILIAYWWWDSEANGICEDSTSSKNILTKDNKSKVVIESKKLKAPVKTTQNKNSIPSSKIHRKY